MSNPWLKWLTILLILVVATASQVGWLLWTQAFDLAQGVSRIGELIILVWLCYGLWHWKRGAAVKTAAAFGISAAYILVVLLITAIAHQPGQINETGWRMFLQGGVSTTVLGLTGLWVMTLVFTLGLWLLRLLLTPGHSVIGIARTVVDEAIRMKIALIFVAIILLVICFLPFLMNPAERLQYRVQTLLSVTLGVTSIMLSLMTVLLSCGTICNEIKNHQIFLTMTKPVGRFNYLLGKWVGVSSLNALLLLVAMVGIYTASMMMRQRELAVSDYDWFAVENQVFVARQGVPPLPPPWMNMTEIYNDRIEQLRKEEPERYGPNMDAKDSAAIRNQIIARWHTLPPRNGSGFLFTNLNIAKELGDTVQLRFKPKASQAPDDEMVVLALRVNGRDYLQPKLADDNYHVIDIPVQAIDANGNLLIEVGNLLPNTSVSFKPNEGIEVLYRVGGFEMNLLRGMAMLWVRLSFLATLGLVAGTFLGFPVACLLAMMVYFTAGASQFLLESLRFYAGYTSGPVTLWDKIVTFVELGWKALVEWKLWDVAKLFIRLIGETFVALIPSFSTYNPVPLLAKGRVVSPSLLGGAMLWVGLVWSGSAALIGWWIFRRRELAQVIV
jgi:hypothetical protein